MPLLNPVLNDSEFRGLFESKKRDKTKIKEILNDNGLSLEETVVELKSIVDNTTDQTLKAKILDIILGVHGVKKDQEVPSAPQIVFQFQNSEAKIAFLLPKEDERGEATPQQSLLEGEIRVAESFRSENET